MDSSGMNCDQVNAELSAYLDDELGRDEAEAVRKHLDDCPVCLAVLRDLRRAQDILGRLPEVAAPEALAEDVQREIEHRLLLADDAPADGGVQAERTLPLERRRPWPRVLAVAATLVLAAGIGILAVMDPFAGGGHHAAEDAGVARGWAPGGRPTAAAGARYADLNGGTMELAELERDGTAAGPRTKAPTVLRGIRITARPRGESDGEDKNLSPHTLAFGSGGAGAANTGSAADLALAETVDDLTVADTAASGDVHGGALADGRGAREYAYRTRDELAPPRPTPPDAYRDGDDAPEAAPSPATDEQVVQAMNWVAAGDADVEVLEEVATLDTLSKVGNTLVIESPEPESANGRLVNLFGQNRWVPVNQDVAERTERFLTKADALKKATRAAGRPAASGLYHYTSADGEHVWLVVTDRNTLSQFATQLAQADGLEVSQASNDALRAVQTLQTKLRAYYQVRIQDGKRREVWHVQRNTPLEASRDLAALGGERTTSATFAGHAGGTGGGGHVASTSGTGAPDVVGTTGGAVAVTEHERRPAATDEGHAYHGTWRTAGDDTALGMAKADAPAPVAPAEAPPGAAPAGANGAVAGARTVVRTPTAPASGGGSVTFGTEMRAEKDAELVAAQAAQTTPEATPAEGQPPEAEAEEAGGLAVAAFEEAPEGEIDEAALADAGTADLYVAEAVDADREAADPTAAREVVVKGLYQDVGGEARQTYEADLGEAAPPPAPESASEATVKVDAKTKGPLSARLPASVTRYVEHLPNDQVLLVIRVQSSPARAAADVAAAEPAPDGGGDAALSRTVAKEAETAPPHATEMLEASDAPPSDAPASE